MTTAGATATFVQQLRLSSKAGLVAAHLAKLPLPAPLQTYAQPGLAREAQAFARVAYLASDGVGAAAERVVIPLLESALDWGEWALIKAALHGCEPGHSKVVLLRRWQAVFALTTPDTITVGSLSRLAALLGDMAAVVRSPELAALAPAARAEHFAQGHGALRPLASSAGGADETLASRKVGTLRLDTGRLAKLLTDPSYIDQKRAVLHFCGADRPLDALRVVLRGELPPPAPDPNGAAPPPPAPAQPLAIFHFLLGSDVESWLVDPELRPVDALRAHLPAYAGDVVLRAMRAPGDLRLELTEFVTKWRAPGSWAKPDGALDAVNDMWLPALAALHGNDGADEVASFERVPHAELYADQNQLTSIRMLFCSLMRGFGFPGGDGSSSAPLSLDDIFEVILERHATHGVLATLAPGVAAKGKALFEGVMAEHGTARAAIIASRDPTSLLPVHWVQTPSASRQRCHSVVWGA